MLFVKILLGMTLLAGIALVALEVVRFRLISSLFRYLDMDLVTLGKRMADNDEDGLARDMVAGLREKNMLLLFKTERALRDLPPGSSAHIPILLDVSEDVRQILEQTPADEPQFFHFDPPPELAPQLQPVLAEWRMFGRMTDIFFSIVGVRRVCPHCAAKGRR